MATTNKLKLVAGNRGKLINGLDGHKADRTYSAERVYIAAKSKGFLTQCFQDYWRF
jgi:hypothetical protein